MDLLRSLPIGIYVEKPVSWLHRLDPRVKLGWLMSLILSPLLASASWRIFLVFFLVLVTVWAGIPWRLQKTQLSWLVFFLSIVFIITLFAGDGFNLSYQPRLPEEFSPPPTASNYQYVLYQMGQFSITRRSLDLAIRITTLIFTLLYSSNLYLLTTAPEKIAAGIEEILSPLKILKLPINEIILTLILALRFIPLVLEEVQNLVRSVRTRAINWEYLGFRRGLQVWLIVAGRLLENILLRAEQIAIAMEVRGFTSTREHQVKWHELRLKMKDIIALFLLGVFWLARVWVGGG